MKVRIEKPSEQVLIDRDYSYFLNIFINEEIVFSVHDGEPEDNNLSRNFSDCWGISDLLKKAFEAGKNNETLKIEEVKIDEV